MRNYIEETNEDFKTSILELTEEDLTKSEQLRLKEMLKKSKTQKEYNQTIIDFVEEISFLSSFNNNREVQEKGQHANIVYILINGYMSIIKNRFNLI
jgi:hypothetical protein